MSNKKKPKKLRSPNVPTGAVRSSAGASAPSAPARAAVMSDTRAVRPAAPAAFDYTYVKHDLIRIGVLAGSFIAILVVLSFFIH